MQFSNTMLAGNVHSAACEAAKIVIFGADGFVGSILAKALRADRIVFGSADRQSRHVSESDGILREADVIINAAGFRVRPGLNASEYRRSHLDIARKLASQIAPGATLIHISSASILGKCCDRPLRPEAIPRPDLFPSPAYATAKLEADEYLERKSVECGFRVMFVMPAVVYGPEGQGMIGTVVELARRGVILRLFPGDARHHLCSSALLAKVVAELICRKDIQNCAHLLVADYDTITNRKLEELIRKYMRRKSITIPVPVAQVGMVLQHLFHSKVARLDLATWGEILCVLNLNTQYDPTQTFKLFDLDPSHFSSLKALEPIIANALGA
jgi:nucleoside-diphosphate-sugar epimerase